MNRKILKLLFILSIVILLAAACGSAEQTGGKAQMEAAMQKIQGGYTGTGDNSYMTLGIEYTDKGVPYFDLYDGDAGNPGVEGEIVQLNDHEMVVRYDPSLFEELPSEKWKVSGGQLKMEYELNDLGILLTNSGDSVQFISTERGSTFYLLWKTQDRREAGRIELREDLRSVILDGWIYDSFDEEWRETKCPTQYFLSERCDYYDGLFGRGFVSLEEFQKLLEREDVQNCVVEVDRGNDGMEHIRLMPVESSRLLHLV